MFIRKPTFPAALVVVSLLALGAASASASASTALRTDPGSALLTGSTTIRNTSSDGVAWTFPGVGTFSCGQVFFDADVTRSTSATAISGT